MNTITIKNINHTYTTTPEALKAAKWEPIGDHPGYYIASYKELCPNCQEDEDVLDCYERDGDEPFIGYHTDNLAATDEAGNAVELALDAYERLDTEESYYLVDDLDSDARRGDWDERIYFFDFCELAHLNYPAEPSPDYEELVADWMSENCPEGTRFFIDDCRGFSNEWVLYIDPKGRADLKRGDLPDNGGYLTGKNESAGLRKLSEKAARAYLKDAVMTETDYKAKYGLTPCVDAFCL